MSEPSAEVAASNADADTPQVAQRSPSKMAMIRFRRNKIAVAGAIFVLFLIVLAILAPYLTPHDPSSVDLSAVRKPPSETYRLGTDAAGRDVLTRVLYAGRISITVGLLAATAAGFIGLVLGVTAGMVGGRVDGFIMRTADIVLSFPTLVIVIVFAGLFGPSLRTIILAIGLFEWPMASRVVRGMTLSLKEQEFVEAARAIGSSELRIMVRHIAPAVLPALSVVVTILVASSILLESALSFLGLGVQPPTPSWGNMLTDAQSLTILKSMPWLWLPPGLMIALTVLAVNFFGDGLRDAIDPNQG